MKARIDQLEEQAKEGMKNLGEQEMQEREKEKAIVESVVKRKLDELQQASQEKLKKVVSEAEKTTRSKDQLD